MKVQFLTSYYPPFLTNFFARHKEIENESYNSILSAILNEHFADTGALAFYTQNAGHETFLIISNCEILQKKWAIENSIIFNEANWQLEIAAAQIKKFKPDIFYLESVFEFFGDFVVNIKPYCKIIVSWISSPFSTSLPLNGIDLFLSSTPKFVDSFKASGFKAEYMLPAFDQRILKIINSSGKKDIPFSFVGGWSDVHINRKEALKLLVKQTPIQLWGYGYHKSFHRKDLSYFKELVFPEKKEVMNVYKGEAWGIKMYDILQRSLITFNIHESLLEGNVGNMRMFEATGVGTLILNDHGHNLSNLFEVGKEIESYKTIGEAIEKVKYYSEHPQKAIDMGLNAQKRTLEKYNYENFVSNLLEFSKKQVAK